MVESPKGLNELFCPIIGFPIWIPTPFTPFELPSPPAGEAEYSETELSVWVEGELYFLELATEAVGKIARRD